MATITSSVGASSTTYVITDQKSNTMTIVANLPSTGGGISISGVGNLLPDGQQIVSGLMLMLQTGLRPNVIANTNASFSN